MIDKYNNLPNITVFIHSLQYQWHNDDPNKDGSVVDSASTVAVHVLSRLGAELTLKELYLASHVVHFIKHVLLPGTVAQRVDLF